MKLVLNAAGVTFCLIGALAGTAAAQSTEVKTKTKIEIKDGKDVTMTGCLQRNAAGDYLLTDIPTGSDMRYLVVGDEDMTKHVNHRVEIKGLVAGDGDGKVKISEKSKASGEKEKEATTEGSNVGPLPYLGVKSIKTLAESCR